MKLTHRSGSRRAACANTSLLSGVLLLAASGAATAHQVWHAVYNGTSSGADVPLASVTDAQGDLYIVGQSVTTNHGTGITTLEYDPSGKQIWAHAETVPNATSFNSGIAFAGIARDSATGNITVVAARASQTTGMVATYTASGKRLGAAQIPVPLYNNHFGVQVYSNGDFSIEGTVFVRGSDGGDNRTFWQTSRFTSSGTRLWRNNFFGENSDGDANDENEVAGAGVDSDGNLVVGGTISDGDSAKLKLAFVKYDPSGSAVSTGLLNETSAFGDARAAAVTLDKEDDVYIAGSAVATGSARNEFLLAKFSPDGDLIWRGLYPGADRNGLTQTTALSVALDADENAIVGGRVLQEGTPIRQLVKWDSVGHMIWASSGSESDGAQFLVPAAGSDEFYAVGGSTQANSTTGSQQIITVVSRFGSNGKLHAVQDFLGLNRTDDVLPAGAGYDASSDSLYVYLSEDLTNPNGSDDNLDWVTLKYHFGK